MSIVSDVATSPRPRTRVGHRLGAVRTRWGLTGVLRLLVVAVVLVTTVFPLYWLVTLSIKSGGESLAVPPHWWPSTITFSAYWSVLIERQIYRYFLNSVIVASASALLSLTLGSLAAYGLNAGFRFSNALSLTILSARMVPPIILAVPLFLVMRGYGLLDTYLGLILVYVAFTLPFSTWMMRGFLLEVPSDIEQAALIDGCSRFGVLWRVILPLVTPGLAATAIFCFQLAWNDFLYALILTRTIASNTMPIAASTFMTDQYIEWNNMAATGVIAVFPVVVLMTLTQRYFVRGLTFGAVRG